MVYGIPSEMAHEQPQIGQLWRMRDLHGRESFGVIADMTDTQITLVSFTGNRTRMSPASFDLLWTFAQAQPKTEVRCSRRSCRDAAVFRSQRDAVDDYVCARHVPIGLPAEYLRDVPDGVGNRSYTEVICPSCASPDPTEDRALPLPDRAPWCWWACHLCGRTWITISGPHGIVGAAERGHWYHSEITGAITAVSAIGAVERIEAGRGAMGDLHSVLGPTDLPLGIRLVLEIEPAVVHIVLRRRPARAARTRTGVPRLGGAPNRSPIAADKSNVIPFRPAPVEALDQDEDQGEEGVALFQSIRVAQDWCGENGEGEFRVQSKHEHRRTVTVAFPDGSTRVLTMREFRGMRLVERRNAFERLRVLSPTKKPKD